MSKDLLQSAVKRARESGMTWAEAYRIVATEFGATWNSNGLDGWVIRDARTVNEPKKGKRK